MWADVEDVISITFTGLIKLTQSRVVFIGPQSNMCHTVICGAFPAAAQIII